MSQASCWMILASISARCFCSCHTSWRQVYVTGVQQETEPLFWNKMCLYQKLWALKNFGKWLTDSFPLLFVHKTVGECRYWIYERWRNMNNCTSLYLEACCCCCCWYSHIKSFSLGTTFKMFIYTDSTTWVREANPEGCQHVPHSIPLVHWYHYYYFENIIRNVTIIYIFVAIKCFVTRYPILWYGLN